MFSDTLGGCRRQGAGGPSPAIDARWSLPPAPPLAGRPRPEAQPEHARAGRGEVLPPAGGRTAGDPGLREGGRGRASSAKSSSGRSPSSAARRASPGCWCARGRDPARDASAPPADAAASWRSRCSSLVAFFRSREDYTQSNAGADPSIPKKTRPTRRHGDDPSPRAARCRSASLQGPAAGPVQRLVPSLRGMRGTGSFHGGEVEGSSFRRRRAPGVPPPARRADRR